MPPSGLSSERLNVRPKKKTKSHFNNTHMPSQSHTYLHTPRATGDATQHSQATLGLIIYRCCRKEDKCGAANQIQQRIPKINVIDGPAEFTLKERERGERERERKIQLNPFWPCEQLTTTSILTWTHSTIDNKQNTNCWYTTAKLYPTNPRRHNRAVHTISHNVHVFRWTPFRVLPAAKSVEKKKTKGNNRNSIVGRFSCW